MAIEMPSVAISRFSSGARRRRIRRSTSRSITTPMIPVATDATTNATGYGNPVSVSTLSPMNAPSVTISPWAKLISSVARSVSAKPRPTRL